MPGLSPVADGVATPFAGCADQNGIVASVESDSRLFLMRHSYLLNRSEGRVLVVAQVELLQSVEMALTQPPQI